ncbi:MAG TPA: Fe-S protein assembly co-chaperone HscB [Kofleriaceae bacterium]|nr:Fe-S protein assembly co-chaperone HscB [Kofleriaceae bacterium]
MKADFFQVLGLPRRFALDPAELERSYLERSREVHPDRQAGGSAEQRIGAAGAAMLVNQAYRALRRELPRAEHLLELEGVAIGDNEPVAPELLAEMLELREELAERKAAGDRAGLDRLEEAARTRERGELSRLGELFAALEAAGPDERAERLAAIKAQVILLRYLARYREAFEDEEEAA